MSHKRNFFKQKSDRAARRKAYMLNQPECFWYYLLKYSDGRSMRFHFRKDDSEAELYAREFTKKQKAIDPNIKITSTSYVNGSFELKPKN